MSLSPGDPWGEIGTLPADAPVVTDDRSLTELLDSLPDLLHPPVVALAGGDLCAGLGGRGDVAERRGSETTVATIDIGRVRFGGESHLFAAHLVARGRFWGGQTAAIMNAERMGPWIIAPRAHPGDGLLDVLEGRLGLRERLIARSRARTGAHLPHPSLRMRRLSTTTLEFARPRRIVADGTVVGTARHIDVEILPAVVTVAV